MAFVDELTFSVAAGRGGNGVVRWRHEKGKEYSGPSGGNGNAGGDVYAVAVRDIGILARYQNGERFEAEHGGDGQSSSKQGKCGEDRLVELPIGSVIRNLDTGEVYELLEEGDRVCLAKGGRGGLGNEHFKSSVNTRPTESTPGQPGEQFSYTVELQIIADAGFAGLPNAGKTTLLNALTRANAKVGDYAFTTLSPNLGDCFGFILADIPGLIEGAAEGKGLGHAFLRHIRRTKAIIHCVAADGADPRKDYEVVRHELAEYDAELAAKPEVVVITKTDTVDAATLEGLVAAFRSVAGTVLTVTVLDDASVKRFRDELLAFLRSLASKK